MFAFELPKPQPNRRHLHECAGCGSFLICRAPSDRCQVPTRYVCPTCEWYEDDASFDAWVAREAQRVDGALDGDR